MTLHVVRISEFSGRGKRVNDADLMTELRHDSDSIGLLNVHGPHSSKAKHLAWMLSAVSQYLTTLKYR